MTGQCSAYLRARGVFVYSGRRCYLASGHAGQHVTARNGIGAPFALRWGRANLGHGISAENVPCVLCGESRAAHARQQIPAIHSYSTKGDK